VDFLIRLLSYINAAGAFHALFQAVVLLLTRRGNRRAHRFMAFFLLALAVGMALGMFALLGLYDLWPALSILTGSVVLSYGPLFYFYIAAMTGGGRKTLWNALHAVPVLLGMLSYAAYLAGTGRTGVFGFAARSPWLVVLVFSVVQTIGYVAAVIRLLRRHVWLRRRLAVYAVIWAVGVGAMAVLGTEGRGLTLVGQIVSFLIALNTFATAYLAMRQPEILMGAPEAAPGPRYERSSLDGEKADLYRRRLLEVMAKERPYLDSEITLPRLARTLDIPAAHLSQVLNDELGRNFYEFINRYRVDEARRRLASPGAGAEKLIAVAMESGFNSIATFNRVFKEMTGRTPSDYRKNPAPFPKS
jgi:AraC-like DNA-binding protein